MAFGFGGAIALAGPSGPVVAVALLAASATAILVLQVAGEGRAMRPALALAVIPAFLLIGSNGLRVGGLFSWGDAAVLAAAPIALGLLVRRWEAASATAWWTLLPAALLVGVGSLSLITNGGDTAAFALAAMQVVLALAVLPLVLGSFLAASPGAVRLVPLLLAVSIAVNGGIALVDAVTFGTFGADLAGTLLYNGRYAGLTTHPNLLGLAGAITFPVMIATFLATTSRRSKALLLIGAGACTAAVLVSGSRAALIALPASGLGLWLAQVASGNRRAAVGVVVVIGVILTVGTGVLLQANPDLAIGFNRLTGTVSAAASDQERATAYTDALEAFLDNPLLGAGLQGLRSANLYLQLLAGAGLVGVLAFGVAIAGAVMNLLRGARDLRPKDPMLAALAAGCVGSMVAWLVYGAGQNAITDRFLYIPAAVAVACAIRLGSRELEESVQPVTGDRWKPR